MDKQLNLLADIMYRKSFETQHNDILKRSTCSKYYFGYTYAIYCMLGIFSILPIKLNHFSTCKTINKYFVNHRKKM